MLITNVLSQWQDGSGVPETSEFGLVLEQITEATAEQEIEYEEMITLIEAAYSLARSDNGTDNDWGEGTFLTLLPNTTKPNAKYHSIRIDGIEESEVGLTITNHPEETPLQIDDLDFSGYGEAWEAVMSVLNQALSETSRYGNGGVLQFLIDAIYWGLLCWWRNPDTVGSGDRTFGVWLDNLSAFTTSVTDTNRYRLELIEYAKSDQANSNIAIIQFAGISNRDMVGSETGEYKRDGEPDILFVGLVGANDITIQEVTLTLADTDAANEWNATTEVGARALSDDFPLVLVRVKPDNDGSYQPTGRKLNKNDGSVSARFAGGEAFGLLLNASRLMRFDPYPNALNYLIRLVLNDSEDETEIEETGTITFDLSEIEL